MKIFTLLISIALPMLAAQAGYRIFDRNGRHTRALAEKFPFLARHKFWCQILFPLLFIVLFGAVSVGLKLSVYAFFIVTGLAVGIVNGMAVTLMILDDAQDREAAAEADTQPRWEYEGTEEKE